GGAGDLGELGGAGLVVDERRDGLLLGLDEAGDELLALVEDLGLRARRGGGRRGGRLGRLGAGRAGGRGLTRLRRRAAGLRGGACARRRGGAGLRARRM